MKLYEKNIKNIWKRIYGYDLDLDNPITFNEKMQWLKLYESTPIKTQLADKLLAKEWVQDKIGEEYIIKTIKVYDSSDEIDFNELPNQFVLKCNHGSGYNIIVKNKDSINENEVKQQLNQWMNETYGQEYGEYHYKNIKPKIFAEEYMSDLDASTLIDYKFWCFNGVVKYVEVIANRHTDKQSDIIYDTNWNKICSATYLDSKEVVLKKPYSIDEMIGMAANLSDGFCYVRVDFYLIGNKIYFGEMTFTPAGGYDIFSKDDIYLIFGNDLVLPNNAYNFDKNVYFKPKKNIFTIIKNSIYYKKKIGNLRLLKIFGISFKYTKANKCKKN